MDEGYIKYSCKWTESEPISKEEIQEINAWRKKLFNLGLIGVYDNGIGFGNISVRYKSNKFLISGSATGGIEDLNEHQYVVVDEYDLEQNSLTCVGPIKASSESLSHAVIYESSPKTNAVIHIHNKKMWEKYMNNIPTTSAAIAYGTPEMAKEIQKLFNENAFKQIKALVMGGHEEGVITFGDTLEEAGEVLMGLYK